ncbi:hypothetical protein [Luteolibacter marinus]|uniref:hypothetical protein n=1 Tax=Luteolibacter marinus TaxID=2776705 RepID=UPI001868CB9B|nr:hypothetical protein [Luteolibacter marinus]
MTPSPFGSPQGSKAGIALLEPGMPATRESLITAAIALSAIALAAEGPEIRRVIGRNLLPESTGTPHLVAVATAAGLALCVRRPGRN